MIIIIITLFISSVHAYKYVMRSNQWIKLTFNGDPDITDNWNGIYLFTGQSICCLDGNPLNLFDVYGTPHKLFLGFGIIESSYKQRRHAELWFMRRSNFTMQMITRFTTHVDNDRETKLLASTHYIHSKHTPTCSCTCYDRAGIQYTLSVK